MCHREFGAGATTCSDDGVPLVALHSDANMRPEDLVGRIVEGRYKIERIIGKGGMGTVYSCRHVVVGKLAAMKVLKSGVERSDGVLQRFVREAQTANLLRSRHIVEVSDFGQLPNGSFFVVMELLEGKDLGHAMRQGLQRPQLAHIFEQVAETLQVAHEKGIVHRDLKPDNVFLVNEAGDPLFVKLLDFGIAKILHGESSGGLTETGVILGTPYYMSPEQARAEAVDHRSDIYSLGVMMYRAFTGRLPFLADSTMGVLTRHITETPEPPSKLTAIDGITERLILRCMEKRPENRFQSMREVADTLRQLPTAAPQIREQAAAYAVATGTQHPVATSGAYAPAVPSGAYAPATSGPYAPVTTSGAYAAANGQHAARTSAPQALSGAHDPRVSSAPGVGYAAPPAIVGVVPHAPSAGDTSTSLHTPGDGMPASGETSRGLAATGITSPARRTSAVALVLGAAAMATLGALAAFVLYRTQFAVPAAGGPSAINSVTATASPTAPTAPTAAATVTATSAPAIPSATEPAATALAPTAGARPHGSPAKAAPTASASAYVKRPPPRTDIRSPFD